MDTKLLSPLFPPPKRLLQKELRITLRLYISGLHLAYSSSPVK
ncbi:MAG TPA: hypothetical protein VFI06_16345 [Chitinophagaceae bacterium]|nr:hypothetical protein [Chitinophagaceae bacterium]